MIHQGKVASNSQSKCVGTEDEIRTHDLLLGKEISQDQLATSYGTFAGPSFGFTSFLLQGYYQDILPRDWVTWFPLVCH